MDSSTCPGLVLINLPVKYILPTEFLGDAQILAAWDRKSKLSFISFNV